MNHYEARFQEAKCIDQQPPNDETNPYENKYVARKQLNDIARELETKRLSRNETMLPSLNQEPEDVMDSLPLLLGRAYYNLGVNYYTTEEPSRAELSFIKAIHFLSKENEQRETTMNHMTNPTDSRLLDHFEEMCEYQKDQYKLDDLLSADHVILPRDLLYIQYLSDALNFEGMIWTNRNEHQRAESIFKRAEQLYDHFINESNHKNEEVSESMENIHTLTTFYLAQVYGMTMNTTLASKYCFLTLQRQLRSGLEFNKREWVKNCMGLSSFFLSHDGFSQSYHFIKAASYVLQKEVTRSELEEEEYQRALANIELSEAEFYYTQLVRSRELIIETHPDRVDWDENTIKDWNDEEKKLDPPILSLQIDLPDMFFDNFPTDTVPVDSVHYLLRTYDEALPIFKKAKNLYEKSFKFFVLDGYVSENVAATQQLSKAYRLLSFFEPDLDRKYAMHLRRSNLLSGILHELNEQYYLGTLKQISFELGEIHAECFELLQRKSVLKTVPNIKRMNQESSEAIKYFNQFCGFFNKDRSKVGLKFQQDYSDISSVEVEEDNRPAFLRAHLSLARMYFNIRTNDKTKLSEFLLASLKEYQFISKYNKLIPVPGMSEELSMVEQMTAMLPLKIQELRGF